jgi:hypothetical protein
VIFAGSTRTGAPSAAIVTLAGSRSAASERSSMAASA